jgi:hypothetical protein
MKKRVLIALVVVVALVATASVVWADPGEWHVYPGESIQAAVNNASDGDVVYVNDGTYDETITISGKDVSLMAIGAVIIAPTSGCSGRRGIIEVYDGMVTIDGFTINANYSSGSGCLGGIYVRSMAMSNEEPATAVISNNTVSDYGKNGITVNGSGATATVLNNTVQGRGPIGLGDWAQNGIQFGYGAKGVGRGNTVTDHYYAGPGWYATGILLFDVYAVDVKTSQNMFRNNQRNLSLLTDQACPHQFGGVYDEWDLCSYY